MPFSKTIATIATGASARRPPPRRAWIAAAALFVTTAVGTGCTRPVIVETDRAQLAAVEVHNESGVTMIVAYEAETGSRATLGAIPPGRSERFIITLPAGSPIRVFGTSEGGGRVSGPHAVTLQAGATQRVTLR